jgi:hypothetical protein
LTGYRILTAPTAIWPLIVPWDDDSKCFTWFSYGQSHINLRDRELSSDKYISATPDSNIDLPNPTSTETGVPPTKNITVPFASLSDYSGNLYCLIKIQSEAPDSPLKNINSSPTASLIYDPALPNNFFGSMTKKIRTGTGSGSFSGLLHPFFPFANLNAISSNTDDVGQILFTFNAGTQTQMALDAIKSISLQIKI